MATGTAVADRRMLRLGTHGLQALPGAAHHTSVTEPHAVVLQLIYACGSPTCVAEAPVLTAHMHAIHIRLSCLPILCHCGCECKMVDKEVQTHTQENACVFLQTLAQGTELFTGAELEGLCAEAALCALREDLEVRCLCRGICKFARALRAESVCSSYPHHILGVLCCCCTAHTFNGIWSML